MVTKSKAELIAENKALRAASRSRDVASVLNNMIKYACLAFLGYCFYLSVKELAGQETDLAMLADLRLSFVLAWSVALAGAGWGYLERALRKSTIERLEGRIRQLEGQIDPKRSSSKLTRRGDTRPEDE